VPDIFEDFRADFERMANDSHGFKRGRHGGYRNPAVARDWKWFCLGIIAMEATCDSIKPSGPTTSPLEEDPTNRIKRALTAASTAKPPSIFTGTPLVSSKQIMEALKP
jgi:hypothetical protein